MVQSPQCGLGANRSRCSSHLALPGRKQRRRGAQRRTALCILGDERSATPGKKAAIPRTFSILSDASGIPHQRVLFFLFRQQRSEADRVKTSPSPPPLSESTTQMFPSPWASRVECKRSKHDGGIAQDTETTPEASAHVGAIDPMANRNAEAAGHRRGHTRNSSGPASQWPCVARVQAAFLLFAGALQGRALRKEYA